MVLTKEQMGELTEFILIYGIDGIAPATLRLVSSPLYVTVYECFGMVSIVKIKIDNTVKNFYLEQLNNV